jgi:hypothetical protein
MSNKIRVLCLVLTCLLSLVATGCVETAMMFHGNSPSPAMNVVALQKGGAQSGTWETFDITINYMYVQSGETLEISGQAVLSQHYQMGYSSISRLLIYLFFLDENSRVLKTAQITQAMTSATDETMAFSQQYAVPAGAKSLSFGYDGTAREWRDFTIFYELPLKGK